METYTLMIEMPWRPISQTLRAADDKQAVRTATRMVSATCADIDGLGAYNARLKRSNGSNVFAPLPISALIAESDPAIPPDL